jgi:hypothetical protein
MIKISIGIRLGRDLFEVSSNVPKEFLR